MRVRNRSKSGIDKGEIEMLTIFDSRHIPTNRHRKSFIACRASTGFFIGRGEAQRIYNAHLSLVDRRSRFSWLVRLWAEHQARCGFIKREKYT